MVGITFIFKLHTNTIWLISTVLSSWRNYTKLNLCTDCTVKSMQGHKLRWYGAVNGVKSTNYLQLLLLKALIRTASICLLSKAFQIWLCAFSSKIFGLQCNHFFFFPVGYRAAPVKQRPLSASSHLVVCVCSSWTRAIGYVRLKVDGPVLLPGKLPPSQSPYSKCCKLVRCNIAPLSLISCMT